MGNSCTRRGGILVLLMACCLLCAAWAAAEDVVVLRDGTEVRGQIVSRDKAGVVIRQAVSGGYVQRTLQPAEVAQIRSEKQDASGVSYLEIPLFGVIGTDVTADGVGAALAEARRLNVRHVVLLIDSPGGEVGEQLAICQRLSEAADLKPVAFVKHAYSAAAIIAMTCPTVVMHPDGQIGAAVGIYLPQKPGQMPRPVEEKYMSAIRASERLLVERAGHEGLFVDAMSEINCTIYTETSDGRVRLSRSPSEQTKLLKGAGSILTMTATESTAAGLSIATVTTLAELGKSLKYPADQWQSAGRRGWDIMEGTATPTPAARAQAHEPKRVDNAAATQAAIRQALAANQDMLQTIEAARREAKARLERDQMNVQFTGAAYSRDLYQKKQAEIQARYDQTIAELDKKQRAVEKEIAQLRDQLKD